LDAAIALIVGTAPYWVKGFISVQLPLWTIAAAIVLGSAAYYLLATVRRHRLERHRRDQERHEDLVKRIDRLTDALTSTQGATRHKPM
jgi:membrane protein implicated in regulation of membrane protease activity